MNEEILEYYLVRVTEEESAKAKVKVKPLS